MSPDRAGAQKRHLLPVAILLSCIVGWLLLQGQRRGWYDAELGLALFTAVNMLVFSTLLWWNTHVVRRSEGTLHAHLRTHELQRINQELTFANRDLEEFTASAAHDLRAPLNAMLGHCSVLRDLLQRHPDEETRRRMERIDASVQRMSDVIDGMLGLAQLTKVELTRQAVDLDALVEEIVQELRQQYIGHNVCYRVDCGAPIQADPRLMRSLLANLLSNAWKYTTRSARPAVEIARIKDYACPAFVVRDNGAGFDMNFAQHLFEPFRRMHTVAEFPGVGIGLATSARIVQRYGGRIWAQSVVGQGTAFHFTLPQAATTSARHRPR